MTLTPDEAKLVEAQAKIERQATEIQRMARKIKNQRGMARTTWQIVEQRAHWTRGILARNRYLDMMLAERKRASAAESIAAQALRERDEAREALKLSEQPDKERMP